MRVHRLNRETPDAADHDKRSREIADTTRRLLVAINTGGIGASFAMAGSLASQKVNPGWAALPAAIFIAGLVATGISLFLAKHRELKRGEAASAGEPMPNLKAWYWRSFNWDAFALVLFVVGCSVGLWKLGGITIPT